MVRCEIRYIYSKPARVTTDIVGVAPEVQLN